GGDGSMVTVTITGVPPGATFSAGTNNGNGSWSFTQAQLMGLTVTVPTGGLLSLGVTATASFPGGGPTTSVSGTLMLSVANGAPQLKVTAPGSFDPTAPVAINVGVVNPGTGTPVSTTIDWGDGTLQTVTGVGTVAHQYAILDKTYQVNVTVQSTDGTSSAPNGV